MTLEEALGKYAGSTDKEKATVLAQVAFDLTVAFRTIAEDGRGESDTHEKITGVNELQHRITSQLLAHLEGNTKRYEDRDFILMLLTKAKAYGVLSYLQAALMKRL